MWIVWNKCWPWKGLQYLWGKLSFRYRQLADFCTSVSRKKSKLLLIHFHFHGCHSDSHFWILFFFIPSDPVLTVLCGLVGVLISRKVKPIKAAWMRKWCLPWTSWYIRIHLMTQPQALCTFDSIQQQSTTACAWTVKTAVKAAAAAAVRQWCCKVQICKSLSKTHLQNPRDKIRFTTAMKQVTDNRIYTKRSHKLI